MKVIVAGSREFKDQGTVDRILDEYHKNNRITLIISGMARGADLLGVEWATVNGVPVDKNPAPWSDTAGKPEGEIAISKSGLKYWKYAGFHRNEKMARKGEVLFAFWDGKSPGTDDMIKRANRHGLDVNIVKV
jgi:hypothetical protein